MILKLILENYIPLMSSGIAYVELDTQRIVNLFISANGSGKGQPLTSLVKVPGGWKKMGEMKVGSKVIARDGSTTTVTGVFPQGIKQVYRVKFADGRYADVDNTHLWKVFNIFGDTPDRWSVINTKALIELRKKKVGKWLYIPLCESEQGEDKEFKIHPYVMGALLGDGSFSGRSSVGISKPYQQLFDKVERLLPDHLQCKWVAGTSTFTIKFKESKDMFNGTWHPRETLKEHDLMGKRSWEKGIPEVYLHGSHQQRLELLQGLLDTDGTVGKGGCVSFSSSSKWLARGVQYLVRSLGGIAKMSTRIPRFTYKGELKDGRTDHRLSIRYPNPEELFTLDHKRERARKGQYSDILKLRIVDIEERLPEPTQCISVEHPERLYVTNDFVVTHNSSILKELNPWPAENGDYENGRKYIELIHNNHLFILESKTHLGNGHSFKMFDSKDPNGKFVEYNGGGTFSVQKELVEAHFGVDNNLIKVAHGIRPVDRLSVMPISRRKDIFMKVYPNDTQYALGVYNKLRAERNDLKSAIKKQIERHAEENRKLSHVQQYGEGELERQIKEIEIELKQALLVRGQLESAKVDPSISEKVSQFKQLVDQLTLNRVSNFIFTEDELASSLEVNQRILGVYKEQASVIQRMISENASHLEGLEEFVKDPEKFKAQSAMIKTDIDRLEIQLSRYNGQLNTLPIFKETELDFNGLVEVAPRFMDYLRRVTLVSSDTLSGNQFKGYQVQLEKTKAKKREMEITYTDLKHRIGHITNAEAIDCPDCSHSFKLGVKPDELDKLTQQMSAVSHHLDKLASDEKMFTDKVENDLEWFTTMNQLFQFIRENDHVKVLSELVKAYDVGRVVHTPLCNALELFVGRFKVEAQLSTLNTEQSLIDARIGLLDRNNLLDVVVYVNNLEEELFKENELINRTSDKINALQRQLKTIHTYKRDVALVTRLAEEIKAGMEGNDHVRFRNVVDDRVTQLTIDKEDKLANIIKNRSLVAVVNSISEDIGKLKNRLIIVETWMDGLCPNKGKIGKMMNDFIGVICANVNAVLQQVWDTPLYVLPCSKENGDLTYKFPVVKDAGKPAPDISDCSAGEADVIDWAFRIVLMNYLPESLPLIMDEVGISFDEIKRARFFNFVLSLTEKDNARQMFMVSHYASVNGGFTNPNIIALRYEGLTMPGTPNQYTKVA